MINADLFRQTMRQFAASISVITTGKQPQVHGMTATSVTSLSMDPPLILVCIHRSNDTHRILAAGGHFGVSILSEGQVGLSNRFASKGETRSCFEDLDLFEGPHGATFFQGCVAAVEAEVSNAFDGGDHTIYVGRVVWTRADPALNPLVHYQGTYNRLEPLPLAATKVVSRQSASCP